MKFITTLRSMDRSKPELVGIRAMDLALLNEKSIQIPLCFVITGNALNIFLEENELIAKISRIRKEISDDTKADGEIEGVFCASNLPKALEEELNEAYESIFVSEENITAAHLMKNDEEPDLLLIPSTDYTQDCDHNRGIRRSIASRKDFISQLKGVWADMFKSHEAQFRNQSDDFNVGIIIQRMINEDISATAQVGGSDDILVNAYFGLTSFSQSVHCDSFTVSKNQLAVKSSSIVHQDFKLIREDQGTEEQPLKEIGSEQKANDKQVIEVARVAKRSAVYLNKSIQIWFGFKKNKLYLMFCNEPPATSKQALSEIVPEMSVDINISEQTTDEQDESIIKEVPLGAESEFAKLSVTEAAEIPEPQILAEAEQGLVEEQEESREPEQTSNVDEIDVDDAGTIPVTNDPSEARSDERFTATFSQDETSPVMCAEQILSDDELIINQDISENLCENSSEISDSGDDTYYKDSASTVDEIGYDETDSTSDDKSEDDSPQEDADDNFIMSIPEPKIEVNGSNELQHEKYEEPAEQIVSPDSETGPDQEDVKQKNNMSASMQIIQQPEDLLANSEAEIGKHIISAETVLKNVLLNKCRKMNIVSDDKQSIGDLIEQIKQQEVVPFEQELLDVEMLVGRFQEDALSLSIDDIKYAFRVANKFMNE
ncbi:MAG: PEP/pyruvate-binding domain-containing protein, partial [Nanoarchaeota archaeon]|nr:PEP/pyruvate-binding domain-containing protein [Nanoarchaeota archaeon]